MLTISLVKREIRMQVNFISWTIPTYCCIKSKDRKKKNSTSSLPSQKRYIKIKLRVCSHHLRKEKCPFVNWRQGFFTIWNTINVTVQWWVVPLLMEILLYLRLLLRIKIFARYFEVSSCFVAWDEENLTNGSFVKRL